MLDSEFGRVLADEARSSLRPARNVRRRLGAMVVTVGLVAGGCSDATEGTASEASTPPCIAVPDASHTDVAAAHALLTRVIGCDHSAQFELGLEPSWSNEPGRFRITRGSSEPRPIAVLASDVSALLAGVNWYLDHVAGISITWAGSRVELPERLAAPSSVIERTATARRRVALNDTSDAYTNPFRTWTDWERLLDLLALHGVNALNITTGQEATYVTALAPFGFSRDELRAWLPLPPHLPWWLMGNLQGAGPGPSEELLRQRTGLGQRIVARVRELGMDPILPGFSGMVPPGFESRVPGSRVEPQGTWNGYQRSDWLDPTSAVFPLVAASYYDTQRALFGATPLARIDLLHEGGELGEIDLERASGAIARALNRALPEATWVTLGWQDNPRPEMLQGAQPTPMLVLDGLSDAAIVSDRSEWRSAGYGFGSIPGFGGRTGIGANLAVWPVRYAAALTRRGGVLDAVAYLPEAAAGNPLAFDLFFELPWVARPVDLDVWASQWAIHRYGSDEMGQVGSLLMRSVYSRHHGGFSQGADSLLTVRPGLYISGTFSMAQPLHYDPDELITALSVLLRGGTGSTPSEAWRLDVVDIGRQVLSDHSRVVLGAFAQAIQQRDLARARTHRDQWMAVIDLSAELAATTPARRFDTWLDDLATWSIDEVERAALERDARTLLTTWGPRFAAEDGLSDYAGREWSGLLETHYARRWLTFLNDQIAGVEQGRVAPPVDWFGVDQRWANAPPADRDIPAGDPAEIGERVLTLVEGRR